MKQSIGMLVLGALGLIVGLTLLLTAGSPWDPGGRGMPVVFGIVAGLGGGLVLLVIGFARLVRGPKN